MMQVSMNVQTLNFPKKIANYLSIRIINSQFDLFIRQVIMQRLELRDTQGCIKDDAEGYFGEEEGEKGRNIKYFFNKSKISGRLKASIAPELARDVRLLQDQPQFMASIMKSKTAQFVSLFKQE
jgi:hypothetical protein